MGAIFVFMKQILHIIAYISILNTLAAQDEVYNSVDITPKFSQGYYKDFILKNEKKVKCVSEGTSKPRVFVSFIVEKDSSISDLTILKGHCDKCSKEALRLFSLMDIWIPGKIDDKVVRSKMIVPYDCKVKAPLMYIADSNPNEKTYNTLITYGSFKNDISATVEILLDSIVVKSFNLVKKWEFDFKLFKNYEILFKKEGYITKQLFFNTSVPEERIKFKFQPFGFMISFDPIIEYSESKKLVGIIGFSEEIDDFDYATKPSK